MPILSSTPAPQNVAIIMDGNCRWAARRSLPRALGHASGARRARHVVQACAARGVRCLSLLAFSTENGKRLANEVSSLMGLRVHHLQKESSNRHANGVCLKVVGDLSRFDPRLQSLMACGQALTAHNTAISLTIAANYGGRRDTVQAVQAWQRAHPALAVDNMDNMDNMVGAALRPRLSNFMGGKWPTPSCFLPTRCGLTFQFQCSTMRCNGSAPGGAALALQVRCWPANFKPD